MRRTAAFVLTLALAVLGAPATAAPPDGTLVIVANGPAVATVTLPAKVELDFWGATYDTASPYVVLTATQGAKDLGFAGHFPGYRYNTDWTFGQVKGRVTLRVLTSGKTTITVPARGLSGRKVVRLPYRLRGATATFAPASVVANTVRHALPFATTTRSHVFHGFTSGRPVALEEIYNLCRSARDAACPELVPDIWRGPATGAHMVYEWWSPAAGGLHDSHLTLTATGLLLDPVTHYVLTVPMA
jgi:hypothetical protein